MGETVYMRNKGNGEIREVDLGSAEFRSLQGQVMANGLSMWEQTNFHHAAAVKDRASYGELLEEDLGHDHQDELMHAAIKLDLQGVGPEMNPHLELTPGEIEQGLTKESKLADLKEQYDARVGVRRRVLEDAADGIADERKERPAAAPNPGASARAGGSDDRRNAPAPGDKPGSEQDGDPDESSALV